MTEKKSLIDSPIKAEATLSRTNSKIQVETKETLEFDPSKIKAGELLIVTVKKWGGLVNQSFAVLNVEGKGIVIEQLKEKSSNK
jgi:hypothetical protein